MRHPEARDAVDTHIEVVAIGGSDYVAQVASKLHPQRGVAWRQNRVTPHLGRMGAPRVTRPKLGIVVRVNGDAADSAHDGDC
jgi:hypothetical protein